MYCSPARTCHWRPLDGGPNTDVVDAPESAPPVDAPGDGPEEPSGVATELPADAPVDQQVPSAMDGPDGGEMPPAWSPAGLPGLALWLDAARGVNVESGRVTQWSDVSGQDNHARPPDARPWLITDPQLGLPAVRFGLDAAKATGLLIPDKASLRWGAEDFSIFVVVRYRNDTGNRFHAVGVLYAKQCLCDFYVGPALFANEEMEPQPTSRFGFQVQWQKGYVLNSSQSSYADDRVHLVVARRSEGALRLRVDGMNAGTLPLAQAVDVSGPGVSVAIGANGYQVQQQLDGEIFEMLAFGGPLNAEQVTAVETYLTKKFRVGMN
jgi:hypothetical protein